MSLFINQGKQDTSSDNKFKPIVAKDVLLELISIELSTSFPDTLDLTLRVLAGEFKNRLVWDRVTFDPASDFSWKYRALRKAANCPYEPTESTKIDIEALLLNRAVTADLGIRKSKDGTEEYQQVTYKTTKATATEPPKAPPLTFPAEPNPDPVEPKPGKVFDKSEAAPKPAKKKSEPKPEVTPEPTPEPAPKTAGSTDDEEWPF